MVFINRINCIRYLARSLALGLASGLVISSWISWGNISSAQVAITVTAPDQSVVAGTGHDQTRGNNSLVLYDSTYGATTRTNPYGVEITAIPASTTLPTTGKVYQVTHVNSIWDCQRDATLHCGNSIIPPQGVVLSASGDKREALKNIHPGDTFVLNESWFKESTVTVNVVDPSVANNPQGSGFPGFRASNQIVIYDSGYGRPNTDTNEFGFEVTVRNGIVTAQEGSNSSIPADGFIISGHGRGRAWLITNAPLGARISLSPDKQRLTAEINFDTYLYQLDQQWAQSTCSTSPNSVAQSDNDCKTIHEKRDQALELSQKGQGDLGVQTIQEASELMNRHTWLSYVPFPEDAIRGVWHRPVEKTPAAIGQTLDRLQSAGLNTVFLETFFHGYTIFPSETFKEYGLTDENPNFAGEDLLKWWVEEAHARHMKVETWFQTFYGGTRVDHPPGPILAKYPTWANVQYSALVPINPPVLTASHSSTTANPSLTGSTHLIPPSHLTPPVGDEAESVGERRSKLLNASDSSAEASVLPDQIHPPLPQKAAEDLSPSKNEHSFETSTDSESQPLPKPEMKSPVKPIPSTLELGGYFLDPANPAVQTFLIKLADEIVTRYNIDGFQLDYIRYPASFPADRFSYRKTTWGYTNIARAAFKEKWGVDPVDIDPKNPDFQTLWQEWNTYKVDQINHFVERITHELHAKKLGLKISAAVFPNAESALALKHQDWLTWGKNGWIDFFTPMTLTSADKVIDHDTRTMVNVLDHKIPIDSGIFGPFNDNSAEQILTQINTAKEAGASGYVLFDTAHLNSRTVEALHLVQTSRPSEIVPPSAQQNTNTITTEPPKKHHHWWWP